MSSSSSSARSARTARPREQSFLASVRLDLGSKAKSWRWLSPLSEFAHQEDEADDETAGGGSSTDGGPGAGELSEEKTAYFNEEDEQALDAVFKNKGTEKEAERLRHVLAELADGLAAMRDRAALSSQDAEEGAEVVVQEGAVPVPSADRMVELLLEVKDVCSNRPDFSKAFVALGGLDVLMGCAAERSIVPRKVRAACFLLLNVLASKNVPIQLRLLDEGAVRILVGLYFAEFPKADGTEGGGDGGVESDADGTLRSRIVGAIDAAVCDQAVAERWFCNSEKGRRVIEMGIGSPLSSSESGAAEARPPAVLREKCLPFLRHLVTDRFSTKERVQSFSEALGYVATRMTLPEMEEDAAAREMALGLVLKVLRRGEKKGSGVFLEMKDELIKIGERRFEEVSHGPERDIWNAITAELEKA